MRTISRWWLIGPVVVAFACGTSDKNPSSGGAGKATGGEHVGNAGSAGSNPGGGGAAHGGNAGSSAQSSGGSLMLGDTPAEACIAYAMAVCSRQLECYSDKPLEVFPTPNCILASLACPDLSLSPGSTRTAAGLKQCAEDYRTFPCDQVNADVLPPCVTPGERQQGEKCTFSSQCASLHCKGDGECGQCAAEVGEGASCAAADVDCGAGLQCTSDTQLCVPLGSTLPPAGPNEACMPSPGCMVGYSCRSNGTAFVCLPLPKLNEPCADVGQCVDDAYCSPEYVCKARPGMGETCGVDAAIPQPVWCAAGLTCQYEPDGSGGTCLPFPKLGEPCYFPPTSQDFGYCDGALRCDQSITPAKCVGPGKPGDVCVTSSDCPGYTTCSCPADMPTCTDRKCIGLRFASEPCGEPNYECHPAFECTAGTCQPRQLRGTFAAACGG